MENAAFEALIKRQKRGKPLVIGMVHLLPLRGSPAFTGEYSDIVRRALDDTKKLTEAGVDAILVENFGDAPFFPGRVPSEVVAQMTAISQSIKAVAALPIGINVLRNDGLSALGIAAAVGASFIRVNILCGARVTDQGVIQGIAHDLLRLRRQLDVDGSKDKIAILADVQVKHSVPLGTAMPLEYEVHDLIRRGGADGLIVSGAATGAPAEQLILNKCVENADDRPVFIGSGVDQTNFNLYTKAFGFIIGSAFKKDGVATNEVDLKRAKELMRKIRAL